MKISCLSQIAQSNRANFYYKHLKFGTIDQIRTTAIRQTSMVFYER